MQKSVEKTPLIFSRFRYHILVKVSLACRSSTVTVRKERLECLDHSLTWLEIILNLLTTQTARKTIFPSQRISVDNGTLYRYAWTAEPIKTSYILYCRRILKLNYNNIPKNKPCLHWIFQSFLILRQNFSSRMKGKKSHTFTIIYTCIIVESYIGWKSGWKCLKRYCLRTNIIQAWKGIYMYIFFTRCIPLNISTLNFKYI